MSTPLLSPRGLLLLAIDGILFFGSESHLHHHSNCPEGRHSPEGHTEKLDILPSFACFSTTFVWQDLAIWYFLYSQPLWLPFSWTQQLVRSLPVIFPTSSLFYLVVEVYGKDIGAVREGSPSSGCSLVLRGTSYSSLEFILLFEYPLTVNDTPSFFGGWESSPQISFSSFWQSFP